jgi:hypothetical protein
MCEHKHAGAWIQLLELLTFTPYALPQLVGELRFFRIPVEEIYMDTMALSDVAESGLPNAYSKPPRLPLVMGDTNWVYASLFFCAGGFTYDLPS